MVAPDPYRELDDAIGLADEHAEDDARRIYKAARRTGLSQEAAMARTLNEVGRVADRLAEERGYEPTFYCDSDSDDPDDIAHAITATPSFTDRIYKPKGDGFDPDLDAEPLWLWLVKRLARPMMSEENIAALGYDPNDFDLIVEEYRLRLDMEVERRGQRGHWHSAPIYAPAKRRA